VTATVLLGRERECRVLDQMLAAVREGESRARAWVRRSRAFRSLSLSLRQSLVVLGRAIGDTSESNKSVPGAHRLTGIRIFRWRAQEVTFAPVAELSLDYARVLASLSAPLDPAAVGATLITALAARYEAGHPEGCALHEFQQSGATYLFDLASAAGLPQEDRTVAAWALTPADVGRRDTVYQRGFPLSPRGDGPPVDRGHVIPHLSGGEFGPNIFRQDRALNRGWSEQGKRYRALEREAAATPGSLYFAHLIYTDESADPSQIETGVLRSARLHVQRFDNRSPAA
jgi:hypothetical protein